MGVHVCHSPCVEVQGNLVGIDFLIPLCGSQGLHSGHWAWLQAPLLTKPSCLPRIKLIIFRQKKKLGLLKHKCTPTSTHTHTLPVVMCVHVYDWLCMHVYVCVCICVYFPPTLLSEFLISFPSYLFQNAFNADDYLITANLLRCVHHPPLTDLIPLCTWLSWPSNQSYSGQSCLGPDTCLAHRDKDQRSFVHHIF